MDIRGGARLLQGSVVCWIGVGAPPRGEALGLRSGLWDGRHCSRRGAAPTRAVAFAGLVWEPRLGAKLWGCARDCGIAAIVRGGAPLLQGRCVCWVGVGAPPRGEALGLRSGLWDSRHCSRRGAAPTWAVALLGDTETKKGDPRVALFNGLTELSSVFPFEHGADHQWWSGRCSQRLACYAVPSSRLSRLQRLST